MELFKVLSSWRDKETSAERSWKCWCVRVVGGTSPWGTRAKKGVLATQVEYVSA